MSSRFEQFVFVISSIYRYIQKIERDEMEQYGYKGAYAQYLSVMRRYSDGLTAAQLCELCDRDKAAVSRIIAEMETHGLVFRERTGEGASLYRALLKLTDEGKKLAAYVSERAQVAVETVGKELTGEKRTIFYSLLDSISTQLQIASKEGLPKP